MPLDEIGRKYADVLFLNQEEVVRITQDKRVATRAEFSRRGLIASGPHVVEHARLLVEQADALGDAKVDSLLKAYERAGVHLDDNALQEIKNEIVQYTTDQQHSAVGSVEGLVRQTFGRDDSGVSDAVVRQIVSGFGSVISRLVRNFFCLLPRYRC